MHTTKREASEADNLKQNIQTCNSPLLGQALGRLLPLQEEIWEHLSTEKEQQSQNK